MFSKYAVLKGLAVELVLCGLFLGLLYGINVIIL